MKGVSSTTVLRYQSIDRMGFLARLFIAVLLITVLEGALRKWVSNDLTYPVVALRDGIAALGVLWALTKGRVRYSPRAFRYLLMLTIVLLFWGFLQILVNQTSLLIYVLGLRFWLLYFWFAFFAAFSFSEYDFRMISKFLVLLLIAMTPLAAFQHFLPPTSFWNKQVDEGSFIFLVSGDVVRTTGTFSFTMGYTTFLAMVSPFAFLSLDPTSRLWKRQWMRVIVIGALLVATIVSGSRAAIVFFGLLFLLYSLSSMRYAKGKAKGKSMAMIIAVIALLVVSLSIFTRAVEATRDRFEDANRVENIGERMMYSFAPKGEISFLGAGIGMGTNFASVLETGQRSFKLAESENARIILEAGWLGIGIVLLKIYVVWNSGLRSLRLARRTGNVSTILIWIAVALALLVWPIVGQLTVNALGYLLFGLGIAALRLDRLRLLRCA